LNIPDEYEFMDLKLIEVLTQRLGSFFISKRQSNHIFFLARGCVMMRQPKTMKEDTHDKVTDRSIPFSQNPAALESPCRDLAEKWKESSGILQAV
jgi:hypothetical protein